MTREEAIGILTMLICQDTRIDADEYEQALEMAISALEKIPKYRKKYKRWKRKALEQQTCEDAVSREDVIALIQCSEYELQDRVDNDAMCDDVRELSSVTVRQKKCEECKNNRTSICGNCNDYDEWEQGFRIDTTLTDFLEERVRFAKAEINNAIESTFCTKDEAIGLGIALNVIDKYFTI